jgi:hypothetical protein
MTLGGHGLELAPSRVSSLCCPLTPLDFYYTDFTFFVHSET